MLKFFKKINHIYLLFFVAISALNLTAEWDALNMTKGVTDASKEVYELHMIIFWICVAIGVLVFGVMFYSMFMHSRKRNPKPASFHDSTKLEFLWTIIPFIILVGMAIPATNTLKKIYTDEEGDINIQVVGYQWKWEYKYLEDNINFFSILSTDWDEINNMTPKGEHYLLEVDQPLVIPVGKKVRFLITANDVIHSWWMPDFAIKQDAIPGFINTAWTVVNQPGIYRGQCTELCGKNHGFMPIVVKVVTQEEYDLWVANKKEEAFKLAQLTQKDWTEDELMEIGMGVYEKQCVVCHQSNGQGVPPVFPALVDSEIALYNKPRHIEILMEGVQGSAMQSFANQLSEVDLAAVITYTRKAWGNGEKGDGEIVVPKEILEYKQNKEKI
tara:strand:- start:3608 stop:4762 length:1155 start_codon:yes stop_codon:yes gene_type:complete